MKMRVTATLGKAFLAAFIACAMALSLAGVAAPVARAEGEVVLVVTANPPAVASARNVDITFTIQNNGAEPLQNVHLYNITSGSSEVTDGVTKQKLVVPDVPAGGSKEVTARSKPVSGPGATYKYRVTYKIGGVTPGQADATLNIGSEDPAPDLEFSRTVSKSMVLKGSSVSITYTLKNLGNVDLEGITITDPGVPDMPTNAKNISLAVGLGRNVPVAIIVTEEVTSAPTVTYKVKGSSEQLTKTVAPKTIKISDSELKMDVTADKTHIDNPGEEVNLHFVLTNSGNTSLRNLTIKDHDNNTVKDKISVNAGKTFEFDYPVKPQETTSYVFNATGTDSSNNVYTADSAAVVIMVGAETVDPTDSAAPAGPVLGFSVTQDTAKLDAPGQVKFTFSIKNTSGGKLFNVKITEAKLGEIETIPELEQGEKIVEKTIDVQKTDIYSFTLSATNLAGITDTINAPVMAVNIQAAIQKPSSNMGFLMILLLVIVGLIVIVLITFIVLLVRNRRSRKNRGGGGKSPPTSPGNTLRRGLEINRRDRYNDRSGI